MPNSPISELIKQGVAGREAAFGFAPGLQRAPGNPKEKMPSRYAKGTKKVSAYAAGTQTKTLPDGRSKTRPVPEPPAQAPRPTTPAPQRPPWAGNTDEMKAEAMAAGGTRAEQVARMKEMMRRRISQMAHPRTLGA